MPAGRHFPHDGHVEIAVGRQRQRAGDRRRGHDEHVGVKALRSQRRALEHTEAMLLVDDRESQLAECHLLLHERMCADHHLNRSAGELRQDLAALSCRGCAGQQGDAEPGLFEQPADVQVMLLGENLGRRHKRDLQAVLHGDERCHERYDCLAGADVPLQQPVHRLRALHVGHNFANDGFLIARQLEWQDLADGFPRRIGDDYGASFPLRIGAPFPQHDPKLKEKELLEDQATVSRRSERVEIRDRGARLRKVHLLQRRAAIDQLLPPPDRHRQRIRQFRRENLQRLMDERALHLGGQLSRFFVDWDDSAGMQRLVDRVAGLPGFAILITDDFVLGALHLQAVRIQLQLSVEDHVLMGAEHVLQKRLVEPDGAHAAGRIAYQHFENLESRAARRPNAAAEDFPADSRGNVGFQGGNRLEVPAILVPCGKPVQQILDCREADVFQVGGASRPDALQILKRSLQRITGQSPRFLLRLESLV